MGRDFRIEEVNGGFIIRAYEPPPKGSAGEMYPTMDSQENSVVVSTQAEAKDFFDAWLTKKAPPFKKEAGK